MERIEIFFIANSIVDEPGETNKEANRVLRLAVKSNKDVESNVKPKRPTKGYVHNVMEFCNE